MLARERWQIKTIAVLEKVFEERVRQMKQHGTAMRDMEDGTGPDVNWMRPINGEHAGDIQKLFRQEYEEYEANHGRPTRMHLVREELAEAFELDGDDPNFVYELLQVAALCVQWAEEKS